jgi:DNA-binding beta-propeller fold protein YncE
MHAKNLATTSTVQFPIKWAMRIALSEFSSKIFVPTLEGKLCVFNRKIINATIKGRAPKIFIQRVYPDISLPGFDEFPVDPIMSCSPTAAKAYIGNGVQDVGDKIRVLDTDTGIVTKTIPTDGIPTFSAFSLDGKYAYVIVSDSSLTSSLSVFSSDTDEEIHRVSLGPGAPPQIRITPDGKTAVLVSIDSLRLFDLTRYKIFAQYSQSFADPQGACISADGEKIYVPETSSISVFDSKTLKRSPKDIVGGHLYGGLASDPNHPYIVACSDVLEIIDTNEDRIVDRVHLFGPNVSAVTDVVIDQYDITYLVTEDGLIVVRFY